MSRIDTLYVSTDMFELSGVFNNFFIANLLLSVPVKEFLAADAP